MLTGALLFTYLLLGARFSPVAIELSFAPKKLPEDRRIRQIICVAVLIR